MTAPRSLPVPRPGVLDIAAYVPGKEHAPGVSRVFKLSANETPFGPSPKAIEAFKAAAKTAKAVIRTGEITPYANIILHAGVIF